MFSSHQKQTKNFMLAIKGCRECRVIFVEIKEVEIKELVNVDLSL